MSDYKYFSGQSVRSNKLTALECDSFKELFDKCLKFPIMIGDITRRQYHKLPKEKRDEKKDVAYLSPGAYATEKAVRSDADIVHCNLLAFDVDDSSDARPFVKHPDLLSLHLDPFNFCAYHSASSTNKEPRIRILVDADEVDKRDYIKAVSTIARRLGVKLNKESRTPALPMYRPTSFQGEKFNPVFLANFDGRAFSSSDIDGKEPETKEEKRGRAEDDAFDALENAKARVESFTMKTAKKCLEYINPDIIYHQWLAVAAALKHQFGDEGFDLFDEWSSKGLKYEGPEKTKYKWNSYSESPRGRAPITARTIIGMAAAEGWEPEEIVSAEIEETEKRIRLATGTRSQMVASCLKWIAKIPVLPPADEDALLDELNKATMEKFKSKSSIPTLRKQLASYRREEGFGKERIDELFQWANDFCFVARHDKFVKQMTMEKFTSESLDRAFGHLLLPKGSKKDEGKIANLFPEIQPQRYLLFNHKIKTVYDLRYDPSKEDRFIREGEIDYLNTYMPCFPEPDPSMKDHCGELFERHLENLLRESEYRKTITEWMAYNVKYPGRKIRWAPLLQGAQGCGKTFLASALQAVLGISNVIMVEAGALGQSWNEWASSSQVVALEELRVAGHNRFEILNKLKPLVTNDYISVSQRHVDHRNEHNITNYIFFTNHHDALPLDDSDRRHFVLKSGMQTKKQVTELTERHKGYFNELFGMLEHFPGGLRQYFLDYRIRRSFDPNGNAPRTKYHRELVEQTSSEDKTNLRELVESGGDPRISEDLVSSKQLLTALELEGLDVTPRKVGLTLSDEGYSKSVRATWEGETHQLWIKAGSKWEKKKEDDIKEEFRRRCQDSAMLG